MEDKERIPLLIEYLKVLQQGEHFENEDNVKRTKTAIEIELNIKMGY